MNKDWLALAFFWYLITSALVIFTGTAAANDKTAWQIDLKRSQLTFSVIADGIAFESHFSRMQGNILFDENDLAHSLIDVTVPIDSVETGNREADELAMSAAFLNFEKWPTAHFLSDNIKLKNNPVLKDKQYWVSGELRLKNVAQKLRVPIKFESNGQTATLSGKATIQRLDFDVGTGEWSNTKWMSNEVEITFSLSLKRKY